MATRLKVVLPVDVDEAEAVPAVDAAEAAPEAQAEMRPEELRLLEAMLFASAEPLDEKSLAERLPQGIDVKAALQRLQEEYATRGVNLARVNGKWTFRTAADLAWLLSRETIETRKLSRAAIETLAIIAYHQPVTRAEIEEIRGVNVGGVLKSLHERGLIDVVGRAEGLGRPLLYGTTGLFLEHFALRHLEELPRADELAVALRHMPAEIADSPDVAQESPADG